MGNENDGDGDDADGDDVGTPGRKERGMTIGEEEEDNPLTSRKGCKDSRDDGNSRDLGVTRSRRRRSG